MPIRRSYKLKAGGADSNSNSLISDVVGNKSDAAQTVVGITRSLIAYIKGLLGLHTVPTVDSSVNVNLRDVVGNKTDKSFSNGHAAPSVIGHLTAGYYHIHDSAKVHPQGQDPILVTANAAAWNETGTPSIVIAANAIGSMFDLHWAVISAVSAAEDYELIVKNPGGEIARAAFSRNAAADRSSVYIPIQVPPQHANTEITVVLSSGSTDADTCRIKFYYHTYPDVT